MTTTEMTTEVEEKQTTAEKLAYIYKDHTMIREQPLRPYDNGSIFDLVYDAAEEACTTKEFEMDNRNVKTLFTFEDGSILRITNADGADCSVEALNNQ